jgi:hypothetical protein
MAKILLKYGIKGEAPGKISAWNTPCLQVPFI